MSCDLEYVDIEFVEQLWAEYVMRAYDAAKAFQIDVIDDNRHSASQVLDTLLWCLEDGGGYWWCATCQCRHTVD